MPMGRLLFQSEEEQSAQEGQALLASWKNSSLLSSKLHTGTKRRLRESSACEVQGGKMQNGANIC